MMSSPEEGDQGGGDAAEVSRTNGRGSTEESTAFPAETTTSSGTVRDDQAPPESRNQGSTPPSEDNPGETAPACARPSSSPSTISEAPAELEAPVTVVLVAPQPDGCNEKEAPALEERLRQVSDAVETSSAAAEETEVERPLPVNSEAQAGRLLAEAASSSPNPDSAVNTAPATTSRDASPPMTESTETPPEAHEPESGLLIESSRRPSTETTEQLESEAPKQDRASLDLREAALWVTPVGQEPTNSMEAVDTQPTGTEEQAQLGQDGLPVALSAEEAAHEPKPPPVETDVPQGDASVEAAALQAQPEGFSSRRGSAADGEQRPAEGTRDEDTPASLALEAAALALAGAATIAAVTATDALPPVGGSGGDGSSAGSRRPSKSTGGSVAGSRRSSLRKLSVDTSMGGGESTEGVAVVASDGGGWEQVEQPPTADSLVQAGRVKSRRLEMQMSSLGADCGPTPTYKHLSYSKADWGAKHNHPGRRIVGPNGEPDIELYPLCVGTGWHRCGPVKEEDPEFAKYGAGIVLYWKFLKTLAVLFFVMTIMALPAMAVFWNGSTYDAKTKAYEISNTNGLASLFYLSLGSLGQASMACGSGDEGTSVTVTCKTGVIDSVQAYYGHPTGSCSCPAVQKISSSGSCPSSISNGVCASEDQPCFLGAMWAGDECCAYDLDSVSHEPDFSSLAVGVKPGCDSYTATYIAWGMCHGMANCTIPVDSTRVFNYTADPDKELYCNAKDLTSTQCHTSFTTYGNFTTCPSSATRSLTVVARCLPEDIVIGSAKYSRSGMLSGLAYLDAISIAVFFCTTLWLFFKGEAEEEHINDSVCTAADYTVKVSCLPSCPNFDHANDYGAELKAHFEDLLNHSPAITRDIPIRVVDVNLVLEDNGKIEKMCKRGVVARKLDRMNNLITLTKAQHNARPAYIQWLERKRQVVQVLFDRLSGSVDDAINHQQKRNTTVVAAFVTFEEEEGFMRCMKAYPSTGWLYRQCMRSRLLFRGRRIKVQRAKEPQDIQWQNLVPKKEKIFIFFRRVFTFALTVAVLLASFAIVYKANAQNKLLKAQYPDYDCSPYTVTLDAPASDTTTDYILTKEDVIKDHWWNEYTNMTSGNTGIVQCYCMGLYNLVGPKEALEFEFTSPNGESEPLCWNYARQVFVKNTLLIVASVVVVAVNMLLKMLLKRLGNFERHETKGMTTASIVVKLFMAQTINTAIIVLLINGNLDYFITRAKSLNAKDGITGSWSLFTGPYNDFNEGWYTHVGTSLTMTMLLNIVIPHITPAMAAFSQWLARCRDRGCSRDNSITHTVTQKELEELLTGPRFLIEERYAQILTTIFVCVAYSSGIPFLMPVAFVSIFLSYCIDKICFIRLYRTPPMVDATAWRTASVLVPYATLLHIGFAMWMYSAPEIYGSHEVTPFYSSDSGNTTDTLSISAVTGEMTQVSHRADVQPNYLYLLILTAFLLFVVLNGIKVFFRSMVTSMMKNLCGSCAGRDGYEAEGNGNYFESIPTEVLHKRVMTATLKKDVIEKYEAELDRRDAEGDHATRLIAGLETYDLRCDPEMLEKLALDSQAVITYKGKTPEVHSGFTPRALKTTGFASIKLFSPRPGKKSPGHEMPSPDRPHKLKAAQMALATLNDNTDVV